MEVNFYITEWLLEHKKPILPSGYYLSAKELSLELMRGNECIYSCGCLNLPWSGGEITRAAWANLYLRECRKWTTKLKMMNYLGRVNHVYSKPHFWFWRTKRLFRRR